MYCCEFKIFHLIFKEIEILRNKEEELQKKLNVLDKKKQTTKNMKKLILVAITLLALSSCNPQPENISSQSTNGDFTIKIIDSCEYIEYDYGVFDQRVYSLNHKGNCKNKIHYNK